jgi:hypothetical protein
MQAVAVEFSGCASRFPPSRRAPGLFFVSKASRFTRGKRFGHQEGKAGHLAYEEGKAGRFTYSAGGNRLTLYAATSK